MEEVKKGSSKWMKTDDGTGNKDFQWQAGYAGFSVSPSNAEEVRKYIENQRRKKIFDLLKKAVKNESYYRNSHVQSCKFSLVKKN